MIKVFSRETSRYYESRKEKGEVCKVAPVAASLPYFVEMA